jgi:hypothetical protein
MPRSPEQLRATVLRLDPEKNYRPADLDNADGDNNRLTGTQETRCNHFVADACLELGVTMPGGPSSDVSKLVSARNQVLWLRGVEAADAGWAKTTYADARAAAARGEVVVPAWLNQDCRCGHPQGSHDAGGPCKADGTARCGCVHFVFGSSHVALAIPAADPDASPPAPDDGLLWIAQAGRDCFNRGRLTRGFGVRLVDLWGHA